MAHGRTYKALLGIGMLLDLILCSFLAAVVVYIYTRGRNVDLTILISFSLYVLLFFFFLIAFLLYVHRDKHPKLITLALALAIAKLLSFVIIIVLLMAADNYYKDRLPFTVDPVVWITHNKMSAIVCTLLYIPIFLIQLFVLNRYYSAANAEAEEIEAEENAEQPTITIVPAAIIQTNNK